MMRAVVGRQRPVRLVNVGNSGVARGYCRNECRKPVNTVDVRKVELADMSPQPRNKTWSRGGRSWPPHLKMSHRKASALDSHAGGDAKIENVRRCDLDTVPSRGQCFAELGDLRRAPVGWGEARDDVQD